VSTRPIRILLDASAITAYTRGSIDVGEVIAEVDDEDAAVGLPVLCMVEATRTTTDTDRLTLLAQHRACVLLDNVAANWQALAATYEIVGRLDAASAALAAIDLDIDILTAQPGLYGGLAGGGPSHHRVLTARSACRPTIVRTTRGPHAANDGERTSARRTCSALA
jgi:hypothetical protein